VIYPIEFDTLYDSFADTVEYIKINSFANNYHPNLLEASKTTSTGAKWHVLTYSWSNIMGEHEVKYNIVELNDIITFYIFHWNKCSGNILTENQSVVNTIISMLSG